MNRPIHVLVGDRLKAALQAGVPVWSEALRWGAGLFETVGCDGGRPLLWEQHGARLASSLVALGWSGRAPTRAAIERLLAAEGLHGPAALRVLALRDRRTTSVVAFAARYRPPNRLRRRGARLHPTTEPAGRLAGLKTCSYLALRSAAADARAAGADAALLLDADGRVRETDHANLFAVVGATVVTPPPGRCLAGVMRAWCLDRLRDLGVVVEQRDLVLDEVCMAGEAWLTSSLEGLVPVLAVGGRELAPVRRLLHEVVADGVPAPGWRSSAGRSVSEACC